MTSGAAGGVRHHHPHEHGQSEPNDGDRQLPRPNRFRKFSIASVDDAAYVQGQTPGDWGAIGDGVHMKRTAIGLVALALVVSACGSSSESESEAALDQAYDEASAAFDVDDDRASGESSDQAGEDATGTDEGGDDLISADVSMETPEGTLTGSLSELPDNFGDFPMPLPEGFVVETAMSAPAGSAVRVAYRDGDFDGLVAEIEAWRSAESDGWTSKNLDIETADGTPWRRTGFSSGTGTAVTVQECYSYGPGDSDADAWNAVCLEITY